MEIEDIVNHIVFSQKVHNRETLESFLTENGWVYRKDKGFKDVLKAMNTGFIAGSGKIERELSCCCYFLSRVIRKVGVAK